LIAGFIQGPWFAQYPQISDMEGITTWADIGVIFLLFGLGLEFSFKKLKKVGKSASITASFKILFMFGAGYLAGQFLNWSPMDSLFLGGILSISSTAIIVRAFDEMDLKGRNFVNLVFGVLVVEDLIAILLLVVLSSVAVTKTLSGVDLAFSSLKLGFFLVLWFVLGIYLLPILMRKFAKHLSDEIMLIVSIGLCLMMVIVATSVGFSPALGAFVMGSLLAETGEGRRIEKLIVPVKDLFAAIFFVSVGMLIDPKILVGHFDIVLFVVLVNVIGKVLSTSVGALVSGRSLKTSVQAGMSVAQIGEFSFIIATLGITLGVTSSFLYPIAVAVSAITTFATPYLIRSADPAFEWIDRRIPQSVREALSRYEAAMATNSDTHNPLALIWQEYGMKILFNSVIVVGITLAMKRWAWRAAVDQLGHSGVIDVAFCALTLILTTPFLWAVFVGTPAHADSYEGTTLLRLRRLQIGVTVVRSIIGFILMSAVVGHFISIWALSGEWSSVSLSSAFCFLPSTPSPRIAAWKSDFSRT
jgi:CPA2 family monovalent cation:H+ antiporter-2